MTNDPLPLETGPLSDQDRKDLRLLTKGHIDWLIKQGLHPHELKGRKSGKFDLYYLPRTREVFVMLKKGGCPESRGINLPRNL